MNEDRVDVSAVVSLIYENLFWPKSWTGLAERNGVKDGHSVTDDHFNGFLDAAYLERVVPYLEHALEIVDKRHAFENTQSSLAALFRDFPLPVCVVSKDLRLRSANNRANDVLRQGALLLQDAGHVRATDDRFQKKLASAVASTVETGRSQTLTPVKGSGSAQSILVVPTHWGGHDNRNSAAALFLNFDPGDITDLAMALADEHGLTQSEAEVAAYLAQGASPDEIAEKKGTSINTVRTQIKSIFSKTGTRRQGELVSLVLNGPALWQRLFQIGDQGTRERLSAVEASGTVMRLADGRVLSYGDYGPRDGKPIIMFHHLLGSRAEKPEDEGLLGRLGIRLIVPERPGVGLSTPAEDWRLPDCAEDIRQLADHLHLRRFSVMGLSAGGPFAAACAAFLGDRVTRLGLVASLMPTDELPKSMETGLLHRLVTGFARNWPSRAQTLLEFRYRKLLIDPDEAIARFKLEGNRADVELFQDPAIEAIRLRSLKQAARLPASIFARELVTLSRPWGFRICEIGVPVMMWHGRHDNFFSPEHAEAMSRIIPDCKAVFGDDWGHFFLYREWESVLGAIAG